MSEVQKAPRATDPDNVPETLCVGRFNVVVKPPFATLTFTHVRPKIGSLIDRSAVDRSAVEEESVVRARIVTTLDNLAALKDVLNTIIQDQTAHTVSGGGSAKLN